VPMIFFDFLKDGDMTRMEGVLQHNMEDIRSLYAVLCRLGHDMAAGESLPFAADRYSCGRIWENAGRHEAALACYAAAGESYGPALRARALLLRRQKQPQQAAYCWQRLLEQGLYGTEPYEELAKYYEHTLRDVPRALRIVEECLDKVRIFGVQGAIDRLTNRRVRLIERLKKGER